MPQYSKQQVQAWLEDLRDGKLQLNEDNMGLADEALILLGMDVPMPGTVLPPGYVSPHFSLNEMCVTSTGLSNVPTPDEQKKITRTANVLEMIRHHLDDKPITVTSAFRSEAVNNAVGGVPNSAHRLGLAADFVCPSYGSAYTVAKMLADYVHELGIDQLIYENKGGAQWVHVGLSDGAPRNQLLTITDAGTVVGI